MDQTPKKCARSVCEGRGVHKHVFSGLFYCKRCMEKINIFAGEDLFYPTKEEECENTSSSPQEEIPDTK